MKVVDTFDVGLNPQHVVPSYDLKTLWVTNNAEGTTDGTLTPIDPKTGKPGQAGHRRRPVQHVLHARRQVRHQRRRGAQTARLPRPADDEGRELAPGARVRRHQPRRLHHRRQVRAVHLRVRWHDREDRRREPHGGRVPAPQPGRHASGHPQLARRQHVLRRRDDARRRLHDRPERLHRDRVHPHRHRHPRPLSEPRRQEALHRQPGQQPGGRAAARSRQRVGPRLRDQPDRRRRGRSPAAAAPTWAT